MTSANAPSEPIVTDNTEALKKLGSIVDYFLFHDRPIAQRCDDSVIRLHNENVNFIRRSRGYAPAPINLKRTFKKNVIGVGAEENVTSCVLLSKKAFISQYVGDVENLETFKFLEKTVHHLMALTSAKIKVIACDLHPKFATTRLAQEIADKEGYLALPVQHHHAHMLSLMGEHDLDEILGIACDGYGYGNDGKAWGGEILHCNKDKFHRISHLQEQPMVGGDLATRYPLRMAAGILDGFTEIEDWLLANRKSFPHGDKEVQTIVEQLNSKAILPTTSSCGRILDAISATLNLCHERTYQGEPALKLESAATRGHDALRLEPEFLNSNLKTTNLVLAIFEARDKLSAEDLANSAQSYLAKGLAQLAIEAAHKIGIDTIGFSGGVAYNKHITLTIRKHVEKSGCKFLGHETIPAGDGGISFGQTIAAALSAD